MRHVETNQRRNDMTNPAQPRYIAYTVTDRGERSYWTRIGAAWGHGQGDGYTISLSALPCNGRLVLLPPRAVTVTEEGGA